MAYRMTTQREIRRAFWEDHKDIPGITRRKIPNYSGNGRMHSMGTRVAFCDYVDMLSKSGDISQELAQRVTL